MADGACPTISPKDAIALGREYFDDLMGGQSAARVLLEGLSIDDQSGNWVVTFGFDSERIKPKRPIPDAINAAGLSAGSRNPSLFQDIELIREFRAVHLSSSDGRFVKLEHA